VIRIVDYHGRLMSETKEWRNGITITDLPGGVYCVQYITLQGQKQSLILKY
jgi:hypothetical protein